MKIMKTDTYKHEYKNSYRGYLVKGALVCGPLYAVGVSALAVAAFGKTSAAPPSYAEVLTISLFICPAFGAAGGLLRGWMARPKPESSRAMKKTKNRITIHRIKAYRRLRKAA